METSNKMGNKKLDTDFESVKLKVGVVNKVRKNKTETGVPINVFFEQAAEEKLKKQSSKK